MTCHMLYHQTRGLQVFHIKYTVYTAWQRENSIYLCTHAAHTALPLAAQRLPVARTQGPDTCQPVVTGPAHNTRLWLASDALSSAADWSLPFWLTALYSGSCKHIHGYSFKKISSSRSYISLNLSKSNRWCDIINWNKHCEILVSCSDEKRNCMQAEGTACKLM